MDKIEITAMLGIGACCILASAFAGVAGYAYAMQEVSKQPAIYAVTGEQATGKMQGIYQLRNKENMIYTPSNEGPTVILFNASPEEFPAEGGLLYVQSIGTDTAWVATKE